jgi:hypothetical protein
MDFYRDPAMAIGPGRLSDSDSLDMGIGTPSGKMHRE